MLAKYTIENDTISIFTQFSDNIVEDLRKIGGKWNNPKKVWELPLGRLEHIENQIGSLRSKICTVQIEMNQVDHNGKAVEVGYYVLARRKERDYNANILATLIAGTIPTYGGSTKYPRVAPSEDSVFEFECYEDFAIRRNLKIIKKPIKTKEELLAEKEHLLARLAQIEKELDEQ